MTPKRQATIGTVLIGLGLVAVALQISQHRDIYSLLAILLGAVGGQQIGQARARSKR